MFAWKGVIVFSEDDPVFHVRYVGCTETHVASGTGCTKLPVRKLIDAMSDERKLPRLTLTVNATGLFLTESGSKNVDKFDINFISYCSADKDINARVFSWIYKNRAKDRMECYAVLCASKEKSCILARSLSDLFRLAYRDWKSQQERIARVNNAKIRQRTLSNNSFDSITLGDQTTPADDPGAKDGAVGGEMVLNLRCLEGAKNNNDLSGGEECPESPVFECANILSELNIFLDDKDDGNKSTYKQGNQSIPS